MERQKHQKSLKQQFLDLHYESWYLLQKTIMLKQPQWTKNIFINVTGSFSTVYTQSLDTEIKFKHFARKTRTRVRGDGEREVKSLTKLLQIPSAVLTTGHSKYFGSTEHLITNTCHLLCIVLPVPSCLEGFWVALSFEADWLSAQLTSSRRLCTSLCTSTRWRE